MTNTSTAIGAEDLTDIQYLGCLADHYADSAVPEIRKHQARLRAIATALVSAAQPGADERRLRRHLCAAFEHLPYMDDGEAQGQSLDWLRCTVDQIEARIMEIRRERFAASTAAPAQQPAPSAAAAEQRELCPSCSSSSIYACTCTWRGSPQADSQPAPVPDEREAFEAWIQKTGPRFNTADRKRDGRYWSSHTQLMWESWQARAARAPADSVTEDTGRLDWLDADGASRIFHVGPTWYTRATYGQPYRKRANLRAAIDAARKQGGA